MSRGGGSIRLNERFKWNIEFFVQAADHFQAQFALAVKHFAHTGFGANDLHQVLLLIAHLLHPELNGLYRIRRFNGVMFLLVLLNKEPEDIELIPFLGARLRVKDLLQALKGPLVVPLCFNGCNIHCLYLIGVYLVVLRVCSYKPYPNHLILIIDPYDKAVCVAFYIEHHSILL